MVVKGGGNRKKMSQTDSISAASLVLCCSIALPIIPTCLGGWWLTGLARAKLYPIQIKVVNCNNEPRICAAVACQSDNSILMSIAL